MAAASVILIALMIIPISPILLDLLLTINITLALTVMLTTLYIENAVAFSVFPTLVLLVTLFRLSLNITATRSILLHGYAGRMIEAFGNIVVGGNFAVGIVVFVILTVIQFVVITSGAGRIAEVAARFTLDAMPGKQLAVDADLNAGLITESEARFRRKGDPARGRLLRGDGRCQQVRPRRRNGDDHDRADQRRRRLLHRDVPAAPRLAAIRFAFHAALDRRGHRRAAARHPDSSTATAIIVTRAAEEGTFGQDAIKQLVQQPRVLIIVAIMLALFAAFGFATYFTLPMAALIGGGYWMIRRKEQQRLAAGGPMGLTTAAATGQTSTPAVKPAESVVPLLSYDPMELEIGFGLIPLVDVGQGGDLLERITMIRRHAARELGIVVPPIRVRDNLQLKPNTYLVKIYGLEVARAEVMVSRLLAMNPGTATNGIEGIATTEPAFYLPALWIPESSRGDAEMAGYTVIDPTSVIATHLTEIIKSHAADLLGRQETSALLDNVKQHYPVVVEELVPGLLTVGEIQRVLQNLLRERIPIRNLLLILENLADGARQNKDVDFLTERVRQALGRHICAEYAEDGLLSVITVDPRLESLLAEAVRRGEDAYALLDPSTVSRIYASLTKQIQAAQSHGLHPIVLSSPQVRLALKRLTERAAPQLVVLSYSEVAPGLRVESIGQVSTAEDAAPVGT